MGGWAERAVSLMGGLRGNDCESVVGMPLVLTERKKPDLMPRQSFLQMRVSFSGLLEVACVLVLAGTALGMLGRWSWLCDLFSHFHLQYLVASGAMLVLALLTRKRWSCGLALIAVVWNVWVVLSVQNTAGGALTGNHALRLMTFNVLTSNPTPEDAIRHVLEQDADIVCLPEVDTGWNAFLEPLRQHYPHRVEQLPHGNFGIAVYARVEVTKSEVLWLERGRPSVRLDFELEGKPVTLIAIHPLPPVTSEHVPHWRSLLRKAAALAAEIPHEVIVTGDLNATPWCEGMRLLRAGSGLDFRSKAPVWRPTWGLRGPMMMAIDHVLLTDGLAVRKRAIGPDVGSDHRSVLVEIARYVSGAGQD